MTIPIKIASEARGGMTVREWRTASRDVWADAGEVWHKRILPRHFRGSAFREYSYKNRSRKYTRRKQRLHGHRRPLEFSGRMRRQLMRIRDVKSSGNTSKRQGAATIKLHGPRYLSRFRKNLNQPDMARELQEISVRDARTLASVMDKKIQKRIDANTKRRKL